MNCSSLTLPLLFVFSVAVACTIERTPIDSGLDAEVTFESARPSTTSNRGGEGTTGDSTDEPAQPPEEDPAREIEEADIVKVDGEHLYALSQYGGLTIVDVSQPEDMQLLGRFKAEATPVEMYVRDGVALVLYNGYGEYTYEASAEVWNWHQASYVIAIDVTDPQQPLELGRFQVSGYISDSRIVGDVLYVVAFEDGYCWGCGGGPRTNLLSIDVTTPDALNRVDELTFEDLEGTYSWQRSVMATNQRMYVAGPTWGTKGEPTGSTIQVVDISAPNGQMRLGAQVPVSGQVQNRWQMDEYKEVLRVVSQPFAWWSEVSPPRVETFDVVSSLEVTGLGAVDLQIPDNESLRSVRFDGPRAYAITALQMDPLFTLDLSDPTAPIQVGELEMPGWVYHMEPFDDRVIGLGFDQGNPDGALTVSLFDVSDLAQPSLIERVNFGGDWGSLAEDQNRIHKSFNVQKDLGLILVPFSGWSYDAVENTSCPTQSYLSGVQLIDWRDDSLQLRGIADVVGLSRRALVIDEHLIAMSDERVTSFSLADRDAPDRLDQVALTHNVAQTASDGEFVARVGYDWYTNTTQVGISHLGDAADPDAGSLFELPELARDDCNAYSYLSRVVAAPQRVYLQYQQYEWDEQGRKDDTAHILALDVADVSLPELIADVQLDFTPNYNGVIQGMPEAGESLLALGSTLVLYNRKLDWDTQTGELQEERREVDFIDLSNPQKPHARSVIMPAALGATGLLHSNGILATSHFVQSPTSTDHVRFYLDRLDVSEMSSPILLPPVNIPGSLLFYDAPSNHALTLDYRQVTQQGTAKECYEQLRGTFQPQDSTYDYERSLGSCTLMLETLHLLAIEDDAARILDSHEFAPGENVGLMRANEERLFVSFAASSYGIEAPVADDAPVIGDYEFAGGTAPLMVFGGLRGDHLQMGRIEVATGDRYYGGFSQMAATVKHAIVSSGFHGRLSVIDAEDARHPRLAREVEVEGWVQDLDVVDNQAIVSLGYDGVQVIPLSD